MSDEENEGCGHPDCEAVYAAASRLNELIGTDSDFREKLKEVARLTGGSPYGALMRVLTWYAESVIERAQNVTNRSN